MDTDPQKVEIEIKSPRGGKERAAEREHEADAVPLFERAVSGKVDYIHVYRLEPSMEEGTVGRLPADATELDIKEKWGGGKYYVEGKDAGNKVVSGAGRRTVAIAGNPVFLSEVNHRKWLRAAGIEPEGSKGPAAPSFAELLTMITTITQGAATQAERAHAQQMEQIRAHQAEREKMAAEREDRQRREDREREERLRREQREYEERRAREDEARATRDREHQKAILELVKGQQQTGGGGELLQTFVTGMKTALAFRGEAADGDGDGEEQGGPAVKDPLTAAIETLPGLITTIVDRARGGGQGQERREAGGEAESAVADHGAHDRTTGGVTLTGAITPVAQEFMATMKAAGKDPEAVLKGAMETMIRASKTKRAPTPAAWPPAPASVVEPPNGEKKPAEPPPQ